VKLLLRRQFFLKIQNLSDPRQIPPVNLGEVENLFDSEAGAEGVEVIVFWPWARRRRFSREIRFRVSAWLAATLTAGWCRTQP